MNETELVGGRYRLERRLGGGGMASVYLARDRELDRPVALKLLHESLAGDDVFRERFVREARLAARLSHPNVVQVLDAATNGSGRPFIVMEYVEGETLADLLARDGRLPPERAVQLALQACAGLAQAHRAGLVHRDVKPHNLIIRTDGTLKVADFGIARAAEEAGLTTTGTVLGTAAYLAPEQAVGGDVTPAADVYGVGAVLYQSLTGRTPHVFDSLLELVRKQREEPIAPVRELAPAVSPALEDVIMQCLARDPVYRPPDAGALGEELARATGTAVTEPLLRRAPRPSERRRLRPLVVAGALGVAALAAGLALALANVGGSSGGSAPRAPAPAPAPRAAPVPSGRTPAEQARNLARWLRAHSR